MINWIYQQKEMLNISDFPDETYGFVYRIVHLGSKKSYIGKKILQNTSKVKLGKKELAEYAGVVGRRPSYKLAVRESNWKSYWGSNKYLKELYDIEPKENFERQILICAPTKKLLTYYEVKFQMVYQVLENPDEFFNDNILGKFFTKDFN
ncbi:MAG: hypothetical protein CMJ25_04895 [Phycisphaerae bacterium]|nr:hypothetical protein [Phycisphaerae bacterium]|tara:strand:- start:1055 stop:1504 length:450 start_codon:yes stop_codon:yes gene_type:complete